MKRAKSRPLRGSERWQALGLFLFLASCIAFGMWIHFSHHEIAPPKELAFKAGPEARILLDEIPPGSARIVRLEASGAAAVRLFAGRSGNGRVVVTLAECRRCRQASSRSRVIEGRLICGHCGEPMPTLEPGKGLPKEVDCTPIPVAHSIAGNTIVIRAQDLDSSRNLLARN